MGTHNIYIANSHDIRTNIYSWGFNKVLIISPNWYLLTDLFYKITDISDKIFIRHNANTELTTKLAFIDASVSKEL